MIAPSTGEVGFDDGLRITAHTLIAQLIGSLPTDSISMRPLPIPGWQQHMLGEHRSSFGTFTVEVATGFERRVEGVFLSHSHSFYDTASQDDSERRAFHDGIIASDLFGQQEFPWGHVFCRLDRQSNRDWLVVIYSPFSAVPLQQREVYRVLIAHESTPNAIQALQRTAPAVTPAAAKLRLAPSAQQSRSAVAELGVVRPPQGDEMIVPENWTSGLASALATAIRELCPSLEGETVVCLDIGFFPWHGRVELSVLTAAEVDAEPGMLSSREVASWRHYNASAGLAAWTVAAELGKRMSEAYYAAKDTARAATAEAFMQACAMATVFSEVQGAIQLLALDRRFRIRVAHPDSEREFLPSGE